MPTNETENTTNVEFVTDLMEFSHSGALAQLFIIDAISKLADKVSAAEPSEVDHPLISGEAWVRCAQEIKRRVDARYGNSYTKPEPGVVEALL